MAHIKAVEEATAKVSVQIQTVLAGRLEEMKELN